MKYALMLGGTLLGVVLGFFPLPFGRPKPQWWRVLTIVCVAATIILGILPPIGGSVTDAVIQGRADNTRAVPIYVKAHPSKATPLDNGSVLIPAADARASHVNILLRVLPGQASEMLAAGEGTAIIVNVRRAESDIVFQCDNVVAVEPLITLPYIIGLEERARIIFFHVPMSWVAVIAYLVAMIYAIRFMRSRDLAHDDVSMAAASVGTLYALLATATGAVWAKFNWGSFWNWDPRETSIFILLLVYAAYFLLRSAIDDPDRRARLSAAYSIVAFATVPFLIFILPRLMPGLHPGSSDDTNIGPLLSPRSDAINPTKQLVFGLSLFSFTMVFFWLMNMRVRLARILRATHTLGEHS